MKFVTFYNGKQMPLLGIGTWQAPEKEVEDALDEALKAGYRHIDAAPVYMNEKAVGRVLNRWLSSGKIKREELFITTKLPPIANRPEQVEATLRASLNDLQLDYVDLYLVHTPFTLQFDFEAGDFIRHDNGDIKTDATDHIAVWKKMEEIYAKGLAKAIGLSNFNKQQIERLCAQCSTPPANLQIEHHLYLQQPDLIEYCKSKNITITAYSPLASPGMPTFLKDSGCEFNLPNLFEVPEVLKIATKHSKSAAQILLRWIVQRNIAAIPKSTNPKRLRENLEIFDFELSAEEIKTLNALDKAVRICDFKFLPGSNKHPEFPFDL